MHDLTHTPTHTPIAAERSQGMHDLTHKPTHTPIAAERIQGMHDHWRRLCISVLPASQPASSPCYPSPSQPTPHLGCHEHLAVEALVGPPEQRHPDVATGTAFGLEGRQQPGAGQQQLPEHGAAVVHDPAV